MSEINNLSDIKENFETIKSLLNSIRAQDVLNTGDLNKLLATMNGKLDRINQEENMELMNAVLASIKQSLDERHSVWVSKFSTIESLFSNILKNSVDSLKSSEIKELFDIIATNLSVFSREVVSQKDTLTDIVDRIEKLRSDDPSSITIISNLDALKRDLERFNNGFESIIVNLNDNFSAIVRTLADIKEKSSENHYDKDFENLYMTSNSLLSAIQSLDNKSMKIEETLASILAKCDNKAADEKISELFQQNKEIYNSIGELAVNTNVEPLYQKIDNATTLISSLKDVLQNVDAETTNDYLNRLGKIENAINKVLDENDFNKLRIDIETALNQIANSVNLSQNDLYVVKNNLETIANSIKALDIHVNFQNIQSTLTKSEVNIKTYISDLSNKFTQLSDLTFQRAVEDIKQKVDFLGGEIKTVAGQNLEALAGSLIGLKSSISDIEILAGASNEKLAKSVGERLSALENTLSGLLNAQTMSIGTTAKQMTELSSTVDLKLDTVSTEFGVVKHSMESLKQSLEPLVELDFQAALSGFKSEICDFQSLLAAGIQQSENENSSKILESVNVRFENLKLQSDECSRTLSTICKDGLSELRSLLNGITSTLIDIVSYVSVTNESQDDTLELDKKFTDLEYSVKDYSLDVIEKINAYIKENIERINTRLTNYDATTQNHFQNLATRIENNSTYIREDIKKAFDAIETVRTEIAEFKDYVIEDLNNNAVKAEFVDRIAGLKNYITESLNAFESSFAQSSSERFTESQAMNARVIQKIEGIIDVNRTALTEVKAELVNSVRELLTNSVDDVMDNVRSFVEVSTNSNSQELEKFRIECNSITQNLQKEVGALSAIVDLGDRVDVVKSNVCEFVSAEFEKSHASISELIKSIPVVEDNTSEIERIVSDLLANQEARIADEIADRFRDFESQILTVENNSTSNSLSVMNKLSGVEATISRALERNELTQSEISERLDVFGNTLYKFIGNGGITVSQAFEKLDSLSVLLSEKSGAGVHSADELIEKIEKISLDISKILSNEAAVQTGETLAELLEKTETTSDAMFTQLQQLSKDTAHYAVAINDSLAFINMELQKPDKNSAIMDEIQSIRSFLDVQVECIDNVHELCKTVADNTKQQEIVTLITDLKSDIITQMLSVLNQVSFSTKEEDIIEFIKLQQEDLRKSIQELTSAVDEMSVARNSVVEAELEKLSFSIERIKDDSVVSAKLDDVNAAILNLNNNLNSFHAELPTEAIEYLTSQFEKLVEDINLSAAIAESVEGIKEKISAIEATHSDFENSFNQVISKLASVDSTEELKSYLASGFDDLYNKIAQRIDLSGASVELNALITTVLAKQDANLAHTMARMDMINNSDVIDSLETLKSDIISQLLSVFNQISFEAESAEIRSDIADAKDSLEAEIKKVVEDVAKLISAQKEMAEDYSTAIARLEDAVENNHVFELKAISEVAVSNKEMADSIENNHILQLKAIAGVSDENQALATALDELKAQVKAVHNPSDIDSNYSLVDIESDLAKLRLSFADMNSNLNKKEFTSVLNSLDTVITQIQDLKEFIPAEKIESIDENTIEVLDILEGLALDLKNVRATQDDIIGEVRSDVDVAKSDIQMSLEDFASEIKEYSKDTFSARLAVLKSEIVTQILAIINQISFVEEQEEIISHIDSVQAQLNKLTSGSEDEMGDYSLFDVETDITKLRITLEEIKAQGRGAEIDSLVDALAQASDTLEFLKAEIPNHEISEIRAELEKIANDIISISIRTNKLLISSDESYKNLKENIEDFQAVMAGVDERTKNLYEEVGMDKIESQVTSIRDIVGRQELTNQVFNEVFEYLAEWIDSTGEKIGYITDKLNNSEDINEIKLSLEELRSSTSVKFELDAQSEKIDAMESKLNVIIESLEPTFQHQNERMLNLERKVNRIVDFFEPAFTKQQERINKLESMLDKILDVVSSDNGFDNALDRLDRISEIVESKDDTQLVKKLTSFEKQITKLNKTVEKLTHAN